VKKKRVHNEHAGYESKVFRKDGDRLVKDLGDVCDEPERGERSFHQTSVIADLSRGGVGGKIKVASRSLQAA